MANEQIVVLLDKSLAKPTMLSSIGVLQIINNDYHLRLKLVIDGNEVAPITLWDESINVF